MRPQSASSLEEENMKKKEKKQGRGIGCFE